MDKYTKEIFNEIVDTQDAFWQKTIRYVCQWLIDQGFTISYEGN